MNKKILNRLASYIWAMLLMCITSGFAFAQSEDEKEWSLAKEDDGIFVYTRKVPGYQIKETRIEAIVDIPIDDLYKVLVDFNNQKDWMVNFYETELLSIKDSSEYVYYIAIDAPWPVMNRDLVIKGNLSQKSDSVIVFDQQKVVGHKEERDKFIRIPMMNGHWEFILLDDGKTKIVNQAHGDPGGIIPSWIINIKLVSDPIKSVRNFIEKARRMGEEK